MSQDITCYACGFQQRIALTYCARCGSPLPGLGTGNLPPNVTLQGGRYIILGTVGRGGMGAVYKAADTRLGGKAVAIKELSDAAITSSQQKLLSIAAFRQEAQMLARLDHPNIPKVSDSFDEGAKHYMAMEFVEGETLQDFIERQRQPVAESQVRMWGMHLCDVLGYLHRQNPPVIFRDLKPANVMLTPQGQLKLIDFGIARFFKAGQAGDTLVMGTPGYAAPEQHGTGQTDARSDIYSLGVMLHCLLTLHDPASTPFSLPPLRRFNSQATSEMEQIVARATQVQVGQRFSSMDELRQALAGTAMRPAAPTRAATPVATSPSRRSTPALLFVAVALLALLAVGWAWGRQLLNPSATSPAPPTVIASSPTEPAPTPTPPPTATWTPLPAVIVEPPPTPTLLPSNVNIQYLVDASNSMVGSLLDGQARFDAVRGGLAQHWQSLSSSPHTALRVFGHRRPAIDTASCVDTELLVSLGQDQTARLSAALAGLTPQGMAPLSAALREASGDLDPDPGRTAALILIADGGDNCGENPQQLLSFQHEVGLRFPIYVAGLAVDEAARRELHGIADLTGGQYRDVASQQQLVQALDEFVRQIEAGAPRTSP
jgi:serine/threonine-protein kinase